jgi:hypothetical protein
MNIADSGYIGWVVWVDGVPIFQSVPHNSKLAQPMSGAYLQQVRASDRNTMDWSDLPHDRIHRLELYGFHDIYDQPVFRMDKPLDALSVVRYCCLTMGSVSVGSVEGQRRTGIFGWKVGWFNTKRQECGIWEVSRNGKRQLDCNGNPCLPYPEGLGISPTVFGLG